MGETEMMNVGNGVEVNIEKSMGVLGMIEEVRVNGKEDMNSVSIDIENEGVKKEGLLQLKGMSVKSAQEVTLAAVKPAADVKMETTQTDTLEMKNRSENEPETETKIDLNTDVEREGIKRLVEMERLAEKERQEKIRRREELDRVARLQRILALVRAPEMDSVAKIKHKAALKRVEITPGGEEVADLTESRVVTDPVLKVGKLEVKKSTESQQLAEHKAVVEAEIVARKTKTTESDGIGKLERMSKSERIAEIDRLANLELEAEAKRKAEIERIVELERLAELERVAKLNRLREINLAAEIKKAEKERFEETKRQEKIKRKEEFERVAKLQRILAMALAAESDQTEETHAANLERVKEMKRRDEFKLLEELGILPREQVNEIEIGKMVKPVEVETPVARLAIEAGVNPVEEVKPVTELRDVKSKINLTERRKADLEARKMKRKEELERISNWQRIIAMVLDTEVDRVAEMKQAAELEKEAERKRKEEINILEDLGILPKPQDSQGTQPGGTEAEVHLLEDKQVNVPKLEKDMKEIVPLIEFKEEAKADVEAETVSNTEQFTKRSANTSEVVIVGVEADKEEKIKRATEMENKAKADREARIKKREELIRVANLQRGLAMVHNEEFDLVPETKKEELERMAEQKRRKDMKVLEELGLVTNDQVTQKMETDLAVDEKDNFTEIKPAEDANMQVGFKAATEMEPARMQPIIEVEPLLDHVMDIEQMSENERVAVKRGVESRLIELRVAQMRRVAELGRDMNGAEHEQHRAFRHFTETERTNKEKSEFTQMAIDHIKTEVAELRGEEELKPLAKTGLSELKQDAEVESNMKGVEVGVEAKAKREKQSKSADFELPSMKRGLESVTGMERTEELKRAESRSVLEIKHETGFELMELKRLREMKRLAGIERVRLRDCEWDGQMMYVGKA